MNAELKRLIALERYRNLAVLERTRARSMTHTPGPWETNEDNCFIHAKDGNYVAQANRARDVDLIAAAPDLLAALRAVDAEGRDANRNGDVIIPSNIWDLVQQAIAKAEGKR